MHIKQVILQGFKSYRDQTVVEPFDKRHNVVVGRNGSGKSNFFYAIQFILSDEFSRLRPEDRQALLHESTGPRAVSAYVEIIFDNSDSQIPTEGNELRIRRVIGAKKDQYFLNKNSMPRQHVMNVLESGGFSNTNPYFIVKQGKINEIAVAPDSHRLNILKEVAGTTLYEEKRAESTRLFKVTESKLEMIKQYLSNYDEKLQSLEEEQEELKQYHHFDKVRRVLEYIIHEIELNDVKKKFENLERQRNISSTVQKSDLEKLNTSKENIKTLLKNIKDHQKHLVAHKEERDLHSNQLQQFLTQKTKLELKIKDLSDESVGNNTRKKKAEKDLNALTYSINEKQAELNEITPQYQALKTREVEYTKELEIKEQKRKDLYAKEGRVNQFASKDDRDKWIHTELKTLQNQIHLKRENRDKLEADIKYDSEKIVDITNKIDEQERELERQKKYIEEYGEQVWKLKKNTDQLQVDKNELWRKENLMMQNVSSLKEELSKVNNKLASKVGKSILNGLDSVRKVLKTFITRGGQDAEIARSYYGLVIENFECESSLFTAVEVTVGNKLFYHIVQSDIVASQILKEINRQELPGVVTFLPLNRINVQNIVYPDHSDSFPMITKLNYDLAHDIAMRFLFGKTLICRNLDIATELAKKYRIDCVTLEGDQAFSKGSLSGGYYDTSKARLNIYNTTKEISSQIQQCQQELESLRAQLHEVEKTIDTNVSEIQKTELKNSRSKGIYEKVKSELKICRDELISTERFRSNKETSLAQCISTLEALQATKESLDSELLQDLMSQLSHEDQRQINSLNDSIRRLQTENKEVCSRRMQLEGELNRLENLLTNNLIRRKDDILLTLKDISFEEKEKQMNTYEAEVEELNKKIEKVNNELFAVEKKLKDGSTTLKNYQNDLETWKKKEKEAQDKIDSDIKQLEVFASKQNILKEKISEVTEKIAQLDVLPGQDLYGKYVKLSSNKLIHELEKTNQELKRFRYVNKKALDQFKTLSEQKEKFMKRKEKLDRDGDKIRELLEDLEQRKLEAILFTYKQVSKYFTVIFKQLVPKGKGTVFMKIKDVDKGELTPEDTNVDNFTGVGIRVSFLSTDAEMKEMNQLSGGQKSLVALAFIFAIQKCDSAPFYLFDEVDQALDAQHRKAVANVIHELSNKSQFITSTFRPELLEHANKFYGVKFRNKVSHVESITKEVAYDFVEDDQRYG